MNVIKYKKLNQKLFERKKNWFQKHNSAQIEEIPTTIKKVKISKSQGSKKAEVLESNPVIIPKDDNEKELVKFLFFIIPGANEEEIKKSISLFKLNKLSSNTLEAFNIFAPIYNEYKTNLKNQRKDTFVKKKELDEVISLLSILLERHHELSERTYPLLSNPQNFLSQDVTLDNLMKEYNNVKVEVFKTLLNLENKLKAYQIITVIDCQIYIILLGEKQSLAPMNPY